MSPGGTSTSLCNSCVSEIRMMVRLSGFCPAADGFFLMLNCRLQNLASYPRSQNRDLGHPSPEGRKEGHMAVFRPCGEKFRSSRDEMRRRYAPRCASQRVSTRNHIESSLRLCYVRQTPRGRGIDTMVQSPQRGTLLCGLL